jgi:biotin operon repressor
MTILAGGDTAAIERIRALLPPHGDLRRARPARMPARHWTRLSAAAKGRFLRALDPHLGSAERIRYRTGTPGARIPGDPPRLLAARARARAVPQLLWPEWAIRLTPPEGLLPGPFRSALAACLLLPGHPAAATRKAITGLHSYRSVFAPSTRCSAPWLHTTTASSPRSPAWPPTWTTAAARSTTSAAATSSPPSPSPWTSGGRCASTPAAHPGEARRHRDAQRYLFQLLTGADLNDPRHALAFTRAGDRARYQAFADTLPTSLRTALHRHAAAVLDGLRISEPLTWAPPPGCCAGLGLPGPDPEDIDTKAVHRLIITGKASVSDAAAELGTSAGHVRFALERVPRPARNWGPGALPVTWRRQQRARAVLTREFFDREYFQAGKTLQDLEAETGFPVKLLTAAAREHGIALARASAPTPIGGDWLREQYQARHRSYAGIAAELGVRPETVIAAARRHHIPSRPFTVHSRPEMTARLETAIPRDIHRAVEGSLQGWHRLRRFQAAMAFPTIEAAASHLGTRQSALIHQLRRLERDIGAPLYHASSPGKPMQPTRRGTILLATLDRPDIHALAMEHAPDMSGPASSRNPGHKPAEPTPAATNAQQAAPLFRALAEPTRLAILLTLQDGEQRITDLAAQLGATQTAVSSHITILKDCGLITGRPQGRSVYYRPARMTSPRC